MKLNDETDIKRGNSSEGSFGYRKVILLAGAAAMVAAGIAARATPPALTITALTGGDMQLTITNGTSTNAYQIYYTPNLDTGYQWNVRLLGSTGQSNFTISSLSNPSGFYKAVNVLDFDGDGFPNWDDANPTNAYIGILSVFIDTPTNGYTFR